MKRGDIVTVAGGVYASKPRPALIVQDESPSTTSSADPNQHGPCPVGGHASTLAAHITARACCVNDADTRNQGKLRVSCRMTRMGKVGQNAAMDTWAMSWRDESQDLDPELAPLLPHSSWVPAPVTPGSVRAVRVSMHGFYGLPSDALLVAWDDQRATVRLAGGELRWYVDGSRHAYPRGDQIVTEDNVGHPYPHGNRYMDALVVRSLEDLMETVNADQITSVSEDGTIRICGEHDNSWGDVVRAPDTGMILRASGVEGTSPWRFCVEATRLLEGDHSVLEPADVTPPNI